MAAAPAPQPRMIITPTKTPRIVQEMTQPVTVITSDEILRSGATTVAEVLRTATGVLVSEQGPLGAPAVLSVRGSTSRQVLVLLDGVRLNSAGSGAYDLSKVPLVLDEIDRIEIVRGPSSALYDPSAVCGVVNIITKRTTPPSVTLGGASGEHRYEAASLYGTDQGKNTYYALSAGTDRSKGYRENSALDRMTAGFTFGYKLGEASAIEASWSYLDKNIGVAGPSRNLSLESHNQTRSTVTALRYRSQWGSNFYVIATGYQNREKLLNPDPGPSSPPGEGRQRNVSTGIDGQINWLLGSWNILTVGVEARGDQIMNSDAGTHRQSLSAYYLQDEMHLGESFILVAGGRQDSFSAFGRKSSPRLSGSYRLTGKGTIFRASLSKSYRAPSLDDSYGTSVSQTGGAVPGTLRPERTEEYEGGIEQPFGDVGMIRFSAFKRSVHDLIIHEPDAAFVHQLTNIGRARITGTETELGLNIPGKYTLTAGYTRLFPVDTATGERIFSDVSQIPHSIINGSLLIPLDDQTTLLLGSRWVKNYVKPGEPKERYYSVDGKIRQTFHVSTNQRGDIFLGVKNLFNREYETIKGYPMPRKEVYGGLSLQF